MRWRVLVLVVILGLGGAGAGAWWGQRAADTRDASAVILINPLYGNPFSPQGRGDDLVNLETEAQLVTSDTVAERVSQRIGRHESIDEVLTGVRVKVSPNTQILAIHVRLASADVAKQRAQAFAAAYLSYRRLITERTIAEQSTQLYAQISRLNGIVRHKTQVLADVRPGSPRARLLDQQIGELTSQVGQLRTLLATATSASLDPGQVVTPATVVEPGLLDGPVPMGGLGLLAGVMGALLLATALARRDDVIRDPSLLSTSEIPVLGSVPHPPDVTPGAMGAVRSALLAVDPRRPLVVLVATAAPDHVLAATPLELSSALAHGRLETVLVDLVGGLGPEFRARLDGTQFGLVDLLLETTTPDEALFSVAPHLMAVGTGSRADRLDDLVAAPEMGLVLLDLGKRADVVIAAGGPLSEPRTQALARQVDLVLVEVHGGRTTLSHLDEALRSLNQYGRKLAGLVYVAPPRRRRRRARVHD
ncbi:MAG TPA: hypothetical protein VFT00_07250 [Nocardioides sp.]|nr:hypothetical protein [Nocardioides sp.]